MQHAMGFTYDAALTQQADVDENDWIGCFVNGNAPQHNNVAVLKDFEALVQHDAVNSDAYPVLIYMRNNVPVAWSDFEIECGYIA